MESFTDALLCSECNDFDGIEEPEEVEEPEELEEFEYDEEIYNYKEEYEYERPARPVSEISRMQPIWFRSIGKCIPPEESRFMLVTFGIEITGISLVFKNNLRSEI